MSDLTLYQFLYLLDYLEEEAKAMSGNDDKPKPKRPPLNQAKKFSSFAEAQAYAEQLKRETEGKG